MQNQAFHRLLTFFANANRTRSSTSSSRSSSSRSSKGQQASAAKITTTKDEEQVVRFSDSLRGDLSLGLNFPLALVLATIRHLVFATGPVGTDSVATCTGDSETRTGTGSSGTGTGKETGTETGKVTGTSTRKSIFSAERWQIQIPSVRTSRALLGGPECAEIVHPERRYGLFALWSAVSNNQTSSPSASASIAASTSTSASMRTPMTLRQKLEMRLDAVGFWALAAEADGCVSGEEVRLFQTGEVMEGIAERRKGLDNILPFWRGGPIWVAGHSWAVARWFDVHVYQQKQTKTA